jgi:hypothetical protein
VKPRLEKVDAVGSDAVDQTMLLRNSSAPAAGQLESERLGLADAHEWIGKHCFYEFQSANRRFAIVFDEPD